MTFRNQRESANTLPELMITALILGIFFSGIFEVSGICLRYISSSKENINAVECVQDRLEQLRNLDFASLTSRTSMLTTLATPPNTSGLASLGTETVTISTFSGTTKSSPAFTITRAPKATTATEPAGNTSIATSTVQSGAVQVDVTYTWNAVMGQRTRSESSSTIVSSGTKK